MVLPYELRSEHEWDPKIPKFPPVTPPVYMGFDRKKETIEDIMLTPRNQIFNRWKVPERMMTAGSGGPGINPLTPAQLEPDVKVHTPSVPMTPLPVPLSARQSPRKPESRMSREMSLPNIKLKSVPVMPSPAPRLESRNGLQGSPVRTPQSANLKARTPLIMSPKRSKTMVCDTRKKSSSEFDVNGMNSALKPEVVPGAEEWMKNASSADKKVIERVLKMAGQKHALESSMKRTLLPDAKDTVEKWMKGANEDERQVALNFFNSLAGGQLMGMTVESQRKRLKEVINTLEDAKPGIPNGYIRKNNKRRKETISDGNLRYIRLLTPNTRDNRWMHTTWHHLPEYKDDDPVGNWSSHYIRPHAGVPRHFVIHPDWG